MAKVIQLARYILISVLIIFHVLTNEFVKGRLVSKWGKNETMKKAIVKTIKGEDGEIIDCFDIEKQPAFDHLWHLNHTLEIGSSSYPNGMKEEMLEHELIQTRDNNIKCPERTLPIRRQAPNNHTLKLPRFRRKKYNYEFALVGEDRVLGEKFNGGQARLNVWKPKLGRPSEFSVSHISVSSGSSKDYNFNSIHAGWMVNQKIYKDNQPHFFVHWTRDNSRHTGCFNLLCPGFVKRYREFSFDTVLKPISVYNGTQHDISVVIYKDLNKGHWWVKLNEDIIGYWPSSIFTTLCEGATTVKWGGEILNKWPGGRHTTTQMGSGHFPCEGLGKASYISNLGIIDGNDTVRDPNPKNLKATISNPNCYDSLIAEDKDSKYGYHILFGGPGLSRNCP